MARLTVDAMPPLRKAAGMSGMLAQVPAKGRRRMSIEESRQVLVGRIGDLRLLAPAAPMSALLVDAAGAEAVRTAFLQRNHPSATLHLMIHGLITRGKVIMGKPGDSSKHSATPRPTKGYGPALTRQMSRGHHLRFHPRLDSRMMRS